jgi:hypothetical protein
MDRFTTALFSLSTAGNEPSMFRFTIRDVLWLTVVVAMAAGWWMDRRSLSARLTHAETVIGGFKLLDERFPDWQNDLASYLEQLRLPPSDEN